MSIPVSAPETWRITQGCQLLWHTWDEEYVIFNTSSGDTHLLDKVSGEILKILEEQSTDLAQLVVKSVERLGLDPNPANTSRIEDLIAKFCELDLIEPALP